MTMMGSIIRLQFFKCIIPLLYEAGFFLFSVRLNFRMESGKHPHPKG